MIFFLKGRKASAEVKCSLRSEFDMAPSRATGFEFKEYIDGLLTFDQEKNMTLLNEQQTQAVFHGEGPLLVLAGAGSGKTRVVTERIAHLLDIGVPPHQILAVTFTNKAADEMRTRIRSLKNAQILTCTFHSLGARILRESIQNLGYRNDFVIYDEEDSEKLLKSCLEELQLNDSRGHLKEMRIEISNAKNNLLEPEALSEKLSQSVYALYQRKLKECNALDFDDLLYLTVKLLQEHGAMRERYQNRWLFILIDEYQDTNFAQYSLTKMLVEQHNNIFAVGDPDQSIYSWRGARYQNILNFKQDFPNASIVTLEQNYRSTKHILQASNALIEQNPNRYKKNLWSALGDGEKIGLFIAQTERQEAEFVAQKILLQQVKYPLSEMAIFYRTNAQSRPFEDALLARRIPYVIIGGQSFYDRREIKDLLAYLRLIISNNDLIAFLRTINLPKRGLGPTTLDKLIEAASRHNLPILSYCADPDIKLSAKQQQGLSEYRHLIRHLRERKDALKIHELIQELIVQSRYLAYLKEDPETFQDRKENIDELIGKAAEWEEEHENPSLNAFLEELSLRSTSDTQTNLTSVKLMTLHNSKGLEFPLVFLVGLEEDLLPHINSKDDPAKIEEERRLCYVGMTRAKQMLYLSAATHRFIWGAARTMSRSRFLKEIPSSHIQNLSPHIAISTQEHVPEIFTVGEKVRHQQFGFGIVLRTFESSFGLAYEIHFPETDTTRTLVAKFAKLTSSNVTT